MNNLNLFGFSTALWQPCGTTFLNAMAYSSPATKRFSFTAGTAALSAGILKLQRVPQACHAAFENKFDFRSPANLSFKIKTAAAALPNPVSEKNRFLQPCRGGIFLKTICRRPAKQYFKNITAHDSPAVRPAENILRIAALPITI